MLQKEKILVYLMKNFPRFRMWLLLCWKRAELKMLPRRVRIAFYVTDSSKWKCQKLYDLLKGDVRFEPVLILSMQEKLPPDACRERYEALRQFFIQRGLPFFDGYDPATGAYADLRQFAPDVLFYQQPWDIPDIQSIWKASWFSLTAYIPYYVPNYGDFELELRPGFHCQLWRYYLSSPAWADLFRREAGKYKTSCRFAGVGVPMIDEFKAASGKNFAKDSVIYAPHYSIDVPGNENPVNTSTFHKNGREILEYAQKHPEMNWIFKPHPLLRLALKKSGFMTEAEIDEYYHAWEKTGRACYDGNYVDLFYQSRALVTDCASFLTEYACTGMPIIHLISSTVKVHPMKPNRALYSTYYKAHDLQEMQQVFGSVLERGEDPDRDVRLAELKKCGYMELDASENIVRDISGSLGI